MADRISILHHRTECLAKTWRADGTMGQYGNAMYYRLEVAEAGNFAQAAALLQRLEADPHACVIRGAYVGDERARLQDPPTTGADGRPGGFRPGHVRRALVQFDDQPMHLVCFDVDGQRVKADPIRDTEAAVLEFIGEHLPAEFGVASCWWQLSGSAGHDGKAPDELRVHLWFWLAQPLTSAQVKAYARAHGLRVDLKVFEPVQPHYTAAPVVEAGASCPVVLRHGIIEGLADDAVVLEVSPEVLALPLVTGKASRLTEVHSNDPVVQRLVERGMVKSKARDGSLNIECPAADEHSSESAETSTQYFPAHTGGYARGSFKCLHAHCDGRPHADFLQRLGLAVHPLTRTTAEAADFDDVTPVEFVRNGKGRALASRENLIAAWSRPGVCGFALRHDSFRDEVMLTPSGTDEWRAMRDSDYTALCLALERGPAGFVDIPSQRAREVVAYVAEQRQFDSAQAWLGALQWDGVERVDSFLAKYMGVEPGEYPSAVSRYLWSALAGRVLQPGCKADMVPVAVGPQGCGKSTTVAAISPDPMFFHELDLSARDDDTVRMLRGRLVIELGELKGLRARDHEHVKSFVSRTHESWVAKYKELASTYARRCLLFGTTNQPEFLADETGHRRWLPFTAGQCDPQGVERDRAQLWAEGAWLFGRHGVLWQDAERLARGVHGQHVATDPWEGIVSEWLDTPDGLAGGTKPADGFVTAEAILQGALRLQPGAIGRAQENRVGAVMKSLGYRKERPMIRGKRTWGYTREVQV